MPKVFFLSHVLDEKTQIYADRSRVNITQTRQMRKGDVCNEMLWEFTNHAGTHIDAPHHFIAKGRTIDQFSAEEWSFKSVALAVLTNVRPGQIITSNEIKTPRRSTDLLLIKTGFEKMRGLKAYWQNAPGLHPDLAGWLKQRCPAIRAVGMDIISVSSIQSRELGREAHRQFLGRRIMLIEDMKLSALKQAPKKVLVAPLRVRNADAAPCNVFAWM